MCEYCIWLSSEVLPWILMKNKKKKNYWYNIAKLIPIELNPFRLHMSLYMRNANECP